jgi:hypothetical protein
MGTGEPGQVLAGDIPLRNNGGEQLIISQVDAGCGCASLKLENDVIAAGEITRLRVGVRLKADGERLSFPIRIHSNDPANPVSVDTVTASTDQILLAVPDHVAFGDVPPGVTRSKQVKLLKPDGSPWPAAEPLLVQAEQKRVLVELVSAPADNGIDALHLQVRLPSDFPLGKFTDTLRISPAGRQRGTTILVHGDVVPILQVVPRVVYFEDVHPTAAPINRNLLLRRADGQRPPPLVTVKSPAGIQVKEMKQVSTASLSAHRQLTLSLNPALVNQELDVQVLLFLQGQTEPLPIRVLVLASHRGSTGR